MVQPLVQRTEDEHRHEAVKVAVMAIAFTGLTLFLLMLFSAANADQKMLSASPYMPHLIAIVATICGMTAMFFLLHYIALQRHFR